MGKKDINWTDFILELKSDRMLLLEKIYSMYKPDFINYAHRFRLEDDQILEVYQNSILVLYENVVLDKIKTQSASIKTYLFSIGKNQLLTEMKKVKKSVEPIIEVKKVAMVIDPDDTYEKEKHISLKLAFEKIGENCKKLLISSYYQGLSNAELLDIYKYKNDQTLRAHKSRCLKKLRTEVKNLMKK